MEVPLKIIIKKICDTQWYLILVSLLLEWSKTPTHSSSQQPNSCSKTAVHKLWHVFTESTPY